MSCNLLQYKNKFRSQGFSLVEVLITIAIIAIVLLISVSRYGSFNNVVLLKNQAFEVALDIRKAQTYAASVRVEDALTASGSLNQTILRQEVGITFYGPGATGPDRYVIFVDQQTGPNVRYNGEVEDVLLQETLIDDRFQLYEICTPLSSGERCDISRVDISFARPDFDALILERRGSVVVNTPLETVELRFRSRNNNAFTRSVFVTASGQVSVSSGN